jgi:type IV fimbrial biogenesis protein FimT
MPAGYTLAELFVGIAIAGILLAWAVPNFIDLYQRNALTTQTNRLFSHLVYTRSEAVKRNLPVVLCRSDDGSSCLRSSAAQTDWSMGWIIFVNTDDDKVRDPEETLLRAGQALPPEITLHFNQWWRVTFRPSGRSGNGSFTLCARSGHQKRITLFLSGRTRLSEPTTDECTSPQPDTPAAG